MSRGVCGRGSGASPPTDCESEVGLGNCCGWERRASGAEPKQLAQHQLPLIHPALHPQLRRRRLAESGTSLRSGSSWHLASWEGVGPWRGTWSPVRALRNPTLVGGRGGSAAWSHRLVRSRTVAAETLERSAADTPGRLGAANNPTSTRPQLNYGLRAKKTSLRVSTQELDGNSDGATVFKPDDHDHIALHPVSTRDWSIFLGLSSEGYIYP